MNSREFDECLEKAKAEQRQMCAKKVTKLYVSTKGDVCWKELADACLNATGESDEKTP